eukprot:1524973-Amphidinium_carterae.1
MDRLHSVLKHTHGKVNEAALPERAVEWAVDFSQLVSPVSRPRHPPQASERDLPSNALRAVLNCLHVMLVAYRKGWKPYCVNEQHLQRTPDRLPAEMTQGFIRGRVASFPLWLKSLLRGAGLPSSLGRGQFDWDFRFQGG